MIALSHRTIFRPSEAYDVALYRSMTAELWLAAAFAGRPYAGLWYSQRLDETYHRWESAARAILTSHGWPPDYLGM